MARRKTEHDADARTAPTPLKGSSPLARIGPKAVATSCRVLLVCPARATRERLVAALGPDVVDITHAASREDAARVAKPYPYDLTIACDDLPDGRGVDLLESLSRSKRTGASVLVVQTMELEITVDAMRSGACDAVPLTSSDRELAQRFGAAMLKASEIRGATRAAARRVDRLRKFCRTLNGSRHNLLRQVAEMGTTLENFRAELDARLQQGTLASEFNTIVRQELDVEGLLRTMLEFLLPRTGPTNAAVFLPASSGDFALGAYVNYDCPKDTAEVLLDHLAATLAPKFEHEANVAVLPNRKALVERLGDDADWLEEAGVVVMSCRHEGECLAVVALFRDERNPFPPSIMPTLTTVRDLFAEQLGRVIKTHHRHLPRDKWGALGDDEAPDDDIDLAA